MPIYLRLDEIQGDVTASGFEGQIELASFSHGVSIPASSPAPGGDVEMGRPSVAEVTVTKATDVASVPLVTAALMTKVLATAQITFVRTEGDRWAPYLIVDLGNAHISSVAMSSGGDRPVEQLSLVCERITWTHKPGERDATFGYDVVNARPV